jgi:hypothetical protein
MPRDVPASSALLARVRRLAVAAGVLPRPPEPPALPGLTFVRDAGAADWLRASMTTFARGVGSFLPGHFAAYARVFHPFAAQDGSARAFPTWRALAAAAGADLADPRTWGPPPAFAPADAYVEGGTTPPAVLGPLVEHLGRATATPERCYFAVWEGHGTSALPHALAPTLELPGRRYHVFAGAVGAARTSFAAADLLHGQSANLWWPADRAWCAATDVDHAWTYVGGARSAVDALLADPRLEAVETAAAGW